MVLLARSIRLTALLTTLTATLLLLTGLLILATLLLAATLLLLAALATLIGIVHVMFSYVVSTPVQPRALALSSLSAHSAAVFYF